MCLGRSLIDNWVHALCHGTRLVAVTAAHGPRHLFLRLDILIPASLLHLNVLTHHGHTWQDMNNS
jgi:hypothetical protein